ncbi:MAG: lipopolysaccharide biosynthesis protein [Clostridia bacterium]|nr:lipopolysaccharide biosynthesis protein [Clostridia bacterium]
MRGNQLKLGVIINYASVVIGLMITLFYTPIMYKGLGESEYGVYSTTMALVSNLSLLSLGMNSAFTRFYSRKKLEGNEEGVHRLNGMFLTVYFIMSALALLCGVIIALNYRAVYGGVMTEAELSRTPLLTMILSLNVAVTFPESLLESTMTVNERYVVHRSLNAIKTIANPALMLPILLLPSLAKWRTSVALAAILLIVHCLHILWCFLYCKKALRFKARFGHFDMPLMRSIASFTLFVFIGIIVDKLNWSVDKFLLGKMVSSTASGVYYLADQLNVYFLSLATILSNVLIPRVHRIVADGGDDAELSRLFIKVGRLQFMVLAPIWLGFLFFGKFFVGVWANGQMDVYPIALLLMGSTIIPSIQNLGIEIQHAKNKHQFRSILYLIVCVVNIIFTIVALKLGHGGVGAAAVTAFTVLVGNGLIMNIHYKKKIGLDIGRFWRSILSLLPALILPAIAGYLMMRFVPIDGYVLFLLCCAAFVLVYAVSMWLFGFNAEEKATVTNVLGKIKRKLLRR